MSLLYERYTVSMVFGRVRSNDTITTVCDLMPIIDLKYTLVNHSYPFCKMNKLNIIAFFSCFTQLYIPHTPVSAAPGCIQKHQ